LVNVTECFEHFYQAILLYPGHMFIVYNQLLRDPEVVKKDREGNDYSSTVHALTSAIKKLMVILSKVTHCD